MEEWNCKIVNKEQTVYGCGVVLESGKRITLYALEEGAVTDAHATSVATMRDQVVLSSSIVMTGELGSIYDLADGERYRLAGSGIYEVRYCEPMRYGSRRLLTKCTLQGTRKKVVQYIVYTDLDDGVARVDRVFKYVGIRETEKGVAAHLLPVVRFLVSEKALV